MPNFRASSFCARAHFAGCLALLAWWSAAKLAVLTDSSGRGRAGAAAALGANLPNRDSSAGQASIARTVGCFLW